MHDICSMDISQIKSGIGVIAVFLVFVGYVPYIKNVVSGKTTPHIYSWFLWGFVTALAFALQISDGAGVGAYVTLAAASMCSLVAVLALLKKGKKDITALDTFFLILACISVFFWLVAKQPFVSAVLVTLTDLLGFVPTIRKSWNKPYSETLSFYLLNTFRFILAVIALQQYSVITALYPITWCVANGLFAVLLYVRRKNGTIHAHA